MSTDTAVRLPSVARFRADIEGLRAVAVALVVLHHAGLPGLGGGYIGVDVFFVISGFLITGQLLREADGTGGLCLIRFYGRRARRILPASSLVLAVTVVAAYHWLGPARGDTTARDGALTAVFAANARVALASPLRHYWSLAVEEQFYLVWPALIALLLWLGLRHAVPLVLCFCTAGSLAYAVWQGGSNSSPVARAWELGAGCLLALVARHLDRIPGRIAVAMAGLGLALIVLAALDSTAYAPGLAVAGSVLVLAGRGDALLATSPMGALGRLSFSFYLWHWPVLVIASQAYVPLGWWQRALLVLGSLGLAAVTYVCVENPIRRSNRLRRSPLLTFGIVFLLVALPLVLVRWGIATHAQL